MTFDVRFSAAAEDDLERLFDFLPDTGYVALYEIAGRSKVLVLARRHQREEDYQ